MYNMAPFQENVNVNNEQAIREYLHMYVQHDYTEQMYREQSLEIFRVLNRIYAIEHPEIAARVLNSYRAVIAVYARVVPLFELEGFGM